MFVMDEPWADETWVELILTQQDGAEIGRVFGLATSRSGAGAVWEAKRWCREHCTQDWDLREAKMILYLKPEDAALFVLAHNVR